jgi:hypothetical protein
MSSYVLEHTIPIKALLPVRALGVISIAGMLLSSIPPSSIVGAILWAGYLGNAVVTHFN